MSIIEKVVLTFGILGAIYVYVMSKIVGRDKSNIIEREIDFDLKEKNTFIDHSSVDELIRAENDKRREHKRSKSE